MSNKYPEYILKTLRQRWDLDENDTSSDDELNKMDKDTAFRNVLNWKGFLGRWDIDIKNWIRDIYGVDLNEIE